jgi:3-deoxy-D-manno-octulosonate 8-phosphate phosphatase KdsC-like HAD superfamily phosphatase
MISPTDDDVDQMSLAAPGALLHTEFAEHGRERLHVKDGQGLQGLQDLGTEVAMLSGRTSPSTLHRARTLGIMYTSVGTEDTLSTLHMVCQQLVSLWRSVTLCV